MHAPTSPRSRRISMPSYRAGGCCRGGEWLLPCLGCLVSLLTAVDAWVPVSSSGAPHHTSFRPCMGQIMQVQGGRVAMECGCRGRGLLHAQAHAHGFLPIHLPAVQQQQQVSDLSRVSTARPAASRCSSNCFFPRNKMAFVYPQREALKNSVVSAGAGESGDEGSRPPVTLTGVVLLAMTIMLEVAGATCMKLSNNFTFLLPSVLLFIFYGSSFTLFTFGMP